MAACLITDSTTDREACGQNQSENPWIGSSNGSRFETYAIAGERGSGVCSVQGAAARLSAKGDRLIMMSFEVTEEPIDPKMILVDEENRFVEYLEGAKHVQQVH